MRKTFDELTTWLESHDGIAHRDDLLREGFAIALLRSFVRDRRATLIRRVWLALPQADGHLVTAARAGGRVSCITLARRRGWWMPEAVSGGIHLHLPPTAGSARLGDAWPGVLHWAKPVMPWGAPALVGSVEDALAHIAICQPYDVALVLWESAANIEKLAGDYLRGLAWASRAARNLAAQVTGLSDSGLETLLVEPLRRAGLRVRQQIVLAGRPVDLVIGDRLVVQLDGYAFHSSSAQRSSDIAHDAQLRLRGYTVLRFSYAQVVHDAANVLLTLRRAVAAGYARAV